MTLVPVPQTKTMQRTAGFIPRRPLFLLLLLFAGILVAPRFAPYDTNDVTAVSVEKNLPPSFAHPFGTDRTNRDMFSRVLKGAQISLVIGIGAVSIAVVLGAVYGTLAALAGGWAEQVLIRVTEVALSIPRFLVLLAVTSITMVSLTPERLIVLIGLTGWFDIARITRGETGALLGRDWVVASRAGGVGTVRLVLRHIFPHILPMLLVVATLAIARTIVLEAALAFLGAGGNTDSLGGLLQSSSALWSRFWWVSVFPGLTIVLLVFACNALGDALRDVFAPEQVHAWPTT